MASEVEKVNERTLGRIFLSNHSTYNLPGPCRLSERKGMPAISPPLSALLQDPGKRSFDSWISETEFFAIKRSKITARKLLPLGVHPITFNFQSAENPTENPHSGVFEAAARLVDVDHCRYSSLECVGTNESPTRTTGGATVPMAPEHRSFPESWKFRVVAASRCKSPSLRASDVIGTIDFNSDGELFATGGIARKIRICSYAKMVKASDADEDFLSDDEDHDGSDSNSVMRDRRSRRWGRTLDHSESSVGEICTPGKLSSLKWRPDGSDVIGCGDYDGVVSEWSVEHGHTVREWYEHSGQRVWSLDYSKTAPTQSVSASEDGTFRVWSRGVEASVAVIRPASGNSICCAEFSPESEHLIAAASADSNVYLYDLRKADSALSRLLGHNKAVSYVRFLGRDRLVSASVDSTLKLWDISSSLAAGEDYEECSGSSKISDGRLARTFGAHSNVRNFVGLSVHKGAGVVACGSETNEVFLYRKSSAIPLLHHKFPSGFSGLRSGEVGQSFVGAVCWREQGDNYSLVAANSDGIVQVLEAINND